MRGTTTALGTPYPLGLLLPAVFQEDDLLMRFTGAIDLLIAPAISTLDCLAAYVDPALAPPDYLGWLATWVGIELDETWPVEQQRAAITEAVALHRGRGTVGGLRRQLELATGGEVEVLDSGGVSWSVVPVDEPAGQAPPSVQVIARSNKIGLAALEAVVDAAKPAQVVHEVRIEPVSGER
ncbi:phage tail protein I [Kribbella sp. CA-293567]|uniref:phage tail protein I n=1 Tax=Kribbella sp. CA-293567 TaxID=3002436 RepID=UPI0022DDCA1A|nr:phage tail protein I [Kribbella sp. CA-293567]WBQ06502.1 phage tail protein I [Kribbella sp. CA-293567]